MPYLIVCLYNILKYRKGHSLTFFLYLILATSSICAYLVGRQPNIFDTDIILYTLYILLLLSIMFNSFKKYRYINKFSTEGINLGKLAFLEKVVIGVSIIIFLLYLYVLYHSLSLLLFQSVTVNEFKNDDDGATELFDSLFPHIISTLLNLLNPFAFFNIVFHFYYLIKNKIKKSVLFFGE